MNICTGLETMTSVRLSTLKLHDLTDTYQAYLAVEALLVAYHNLMIYSPGEGPGVITVVLIARP